MKSPILFLNFHEKKSISLSVFIFFLFENQPNKSNPELDLFVSLFCLYTVCYFLLIYTTILRLFMYGLFPSDYSVKSLLWQE